MNQKSGRDMVEKSFGAQLFGARLLGSANAFGASYDARKRRTPQGRKGALSGLSEEP